MKNLLFVCFFLLSGSLMAQLVDFDLRTADYATGKKLSGVTIEVYEGTNLVKTEVTPSSGNAKFNLPAGKVYVLLFSKAGKVTRQMKVNTKGIDDEAIQGGKNAFALIEVNLFDEVSGIDYSYIEKNPITEFYFDGVSPKLAYDEVLANKMRKKVEEILKQSEAQASQADAKYQDAIAKADDWYKKKNWQFALDKYKEAALLKPDEKYPQERIVELDALLKKEKQDQLAEKQKEDEYKKIVATADALRDQKKYNEAIAKYNEALKIKEEQYVRDQIANINKSIADEKKAQELEANYKKAMDAGETMFSQKKYAEAKTSFNEALKLKPNDPTALKRLADIEAKIKEDANAAEKKKKYDAKILEAEQLLASNKLAEARVKFVEAKGIDNTQTYPDTKIKEIDGKLATQAADKEKKEKYDLAMKAADDLFNANKLQEAKLKYEEASKIDPAQTKPSENIAKINKMLADQEAAKREKEKAEKITALLKDAGSLYAKNDLENAKKKYQEVLALDNTNSEASTKINEINAKIAANTNEAEKTKKFNELKAKGADLMKQGKWSEAKQAYLEAKSLKADSEIDAKLKEIETKIAEENAKLGAEQAYAKLIEEAKLAEASNIDLAISKYKEAQKLKPSDPIPTAKIKELEGKKSANSQQAETDKKYADAMKRGNDLMAQKKYADAIKAFNEAGALKPNEKEPSEKAQTAKELSEADISDFKKQYNKILDAGQKAIDEKNWTKAKELYNRAISLDPADNVPKIKLKEIDALIKAEEDAKKNAANSELAYKNKITEAEKAASSKDYDKAIKLFEEAKILKPTESLPSTRINELKALKNQASASIQTDQLYNDYMKSGDNALTSKNYAQALSEYKNALNVKKNDKAAQAKINEVQQLIDNEKNKSTQTQFENLIKDADALFARKDYINAKENYEKALKIKNDKYAKKQAELCLKELEKIDEEEREYKKIVAKADENFNKKKYDKAIELYTRAKGFRPTDAYPQQKLDEIDALLHPSVASQGNGKLNPLGTPTDDEKEAARKLFEAEETRKQLKKKGIESQSNQIENNTTNATETKTEELYNTSENVIQINKTNEANYESGDEKRQEITEQVEKDKKSIGNTNIASNELKYNENLNTAETAKNVASEMSTQYATKEVVYKDNSEAVKTVDTKIVDQEGIKSNTGYTKNVDSKTELSKVQVKIDDKTQDDSEQHLEINEKVKDVNAKIANNEVSSNNRENENVLNLSTQIEKQNEVKINKEAEDSKIAGNNSLEVDKIEKSVEKSDAENNTTQVNESLKADGVIAQKTKVISGIPTQQDEMRKENVETVQKGSNALQDKNREEYNKNIVKHLNSQENISSSKKAADELTETKVAQSSELAVKLEGVDKNANISYSERVLSDDEQRANTKKEVNNSTVQISNETSKKAEKVEENISGVKTVLTDSENKKYQEELQKKQNLEQSQVLLNKLGGKELKFDDKIANQLGSAYPEGVSQEVFNQTDENNLLVAVVTRRVVVKNGYGQVYIRTQSLNGITYSKNGEPTSEYVWQKETQDSKLKRNY